MVNCNDFKTFKKEKDRMCNIVGFHVELCPFMINDSKWDCYGCNENCLAKTDFAIETVQKWSDEHPQETKTDEFLKLHPNAFRVDDNNGNTFVNICPKYIDMTFNCIENHDADFCYNCKRDYWLEEVK